MARICHRIIRVLMILSFAALPGGFVECDLEDGEFEIDFDEIGWDCDDGGCWVDVWYEPCYDCYECYDPCCW